MIQDGTMKMNLIDINTVNTSYYYLFNLQKRIYQASKEGHLSLVYSLQKLLLYLRSIKLLAVNIVKQKKTNIDRKKNNTITEVSSVRITKQIIYWCLEAEWIPKIHYAIKDNIPKSKNKFTNLFLESFSLNTNITLSTLNHKNLAHKLQPLKSIQKSIKSLLKQELFTNYTNNQAARVQIWMLQADYLYHLLTLIIMNGNHWHYFRQSKITMGKLTTSIVFFKSLMVNRNIYTKAKVLNETLINLIAFSKSIGYICQNTTRYHLRTYYIQSIDCIYDYSYNREDFFCNQSLDLIKLMEEELYQSIKSFLFHKDHLGRLRINNNLKVCSMTENVISLVTKFSNYYVMTKEIHYLPNVIKTVTEMCYSWLKKKYKRPQNFKVKIALCLLKLKLDNIINVIRLVEAV